MNSKVLFIALALLPVYLAQTTERWGGRDRHGHGHRHGPPVPPPFGPIFDQLTDAQKEELKQILKTNFNSTKAQQKSANQQFISTLSSEIQTEIQEHEAEFQKRIAADDEKAKSLSAAAQQFYTNITTILRDDSITRQEERQQIHEVIKASDKSVFQELRKAGIRLPLGPPPHGRHGHHGRPHHSSEESNEGGFTESSNL